MRLLEPTSGTVRLNGRDIGAMKRAEAQEYRRQVQMVFQNPPRPSTPPADGRAAIAAPPLRAQGIDRPAGSRRAYGN